MSKRLDGKYEDCEGGVYDSREEYLAYIKELCDKERFKDNLTEEELAFLKSDQDYRRGYAQGFSAARNNPDISFHDVHAWDLSAPPGSPCKNSIFINKSTEKTLITELISDDDD